MEFHVPAIWKKAITILIHKTGKSLNHLNSYQHVSLTSILSKGMEKMITTRLNCYFEPNNLLNTAQAKFRQYQSAVQ